MCIILINFSGLFEFVGVFADKEIAERWLKERGWEDKKSHWKKGATGMAHIKILLKPEAFVS